MSILTTKMIDDIKIDMPMVTSALVKRYFDEATRKFFFASKRHRTSVDDINSREFSRKEELDFTIEKSDAVAIDGSTLWAFEKGSIVGDILDFDTKKLIRTAEIVSNRITEITGAIIEGDNLILVSDRGNGKNGVIEVIDKGSFKSVRIGFAQLKFPAGITLVKDNYLIGSSDPFDSAIYAENIISGKLTKATSINGRVSTLTSNDNNIFVFTGDDANYDNPKMLVLDFDYKLIETVDLSYLDRAPTSAFIKDDIIYAGLDGKFIAIKDKVNLVPLNFDIVAVEKVLYENPHSKEQHRISNTKDGFLATENERLGCNKRLEYYQPTSNELVLNHEVIGKVSALLSLCPQSHEYIPDYILRENWDAFKSGILGFLYLLPQEWRSPELAAFYKGEFENGIMRASAHYQRNADTFRPAFGRESYGASVYEVEFK